MINKFAPKLQVVFTFLSLFTSGSTFNETNIHDIRLNNKCEPLTLTENAFFIGGYCSNSLNSACGIHCKRGFKLVGSSYRKCHKSLITNYSYNLEWSGIEAKCLKIRCKNFDLDEALVVNCSPKTNQTIYEFGTTCLFKCQHGYKNIGSSVRHCLSIGLWSGLRAKCKKSLNPKYLTTNEPATTTTQFNPKYYLDLSAQTLSFGYSFRKIDLVVNSNYQKLPITFQMWFRTNYTKNIQILFYNSTCFNLSIQTDETSSLTLNIQNNHIYRFEKKLIKNKWTQLTLVHTDFNFQVFLDGIVYFNQLDLLDIYDNLTRCVDTFNDLNDDTNASSIVILEDRNEFKIIDHVQVKEMTRNNEPMRGEITRVYLFSIMMNEEDILYNYYKCDKMKITKSKVLFDWSHVLFDNYLSSFRRKLSHFCKGCKEPDLIKNALIYYDGTRNGDVLSYSCQENYYIVGFASSVCMINGEWSHKTPKCRLKSQIKEATTKKPDLFEIFGSND